MLAQNEDETDTLGQDELNSAPATQRTSNQSTSPASQHTSNQSPPAVVTRPTSDYSSKSAPPPTVTLPKNTKNGSKARSSKIK